MPSWRIEGVPWVPTELPLVPAVDPSALASEAIEKTDGRPGLVGRAARGAAVCAAVALLSGCAGWPYVGAVQPPEMPPIAQPAPAPWPPIMAEPVPPEPSLVPPAAPPEPAPPVARPDTSGNDGDPASMLPVPPRPHPGGDTAANGSPRNPTTGLPPVGPAPPPPTPPAGDDDACVGAWRICHFL